MAKNIKLSIEIPIFKGQLHICIGNIRKMAKKHFKIEYDDSVGIEECNAICTRKNYLNYCIFFNRDMLNRFDTAAHEAKHFVNYLFKDRGLELSLTNDECECYVLGWAMKQIQTAFDRYAEKVNE